MTMLHEILRFFGGAKPTSSASAAKERLMLVISHERLDASRAEILPKLQAEIMEVLRRHLNLDQVDARVNVAREGGTDLLQVEVMLPSS